MAPTSPTGQKTTAHSARDRGMTRSAPNDQAEKPDGERDMSRHRSASGTDEELRLPHEKDQSADQLSSENEQATRKVKQAHTDLSRGLVDTDEGYVAESAKRERDASQARQPAPPKPGSAHKLSLIHI